MQSARWGWHAQRIRMARRIIVILGTGLLCCGPIGCALTGPVQSGPGKAVAPEGGEAALEQRLQVLETGLQQLTQRVEALQAAAEHDRVGKRHAAARADRLPAEYRPVRPGVVLASSPARKAAVASATLPAAAPEVVRQPRAARPTREGNWVINLASYTSRTFASRKLAEFVGAGVAAERVQAEVNGRTVYRLRVPGFASYQAASVEAATIREQLGLKATWIARR